MVFFSFPRLTAFVTLLLLSSTSPFVKAALNPSCAPGGNFDLSHWELQLPIGSTGDPETISSADLQGCDGFENFDYFFTESGDGALVMKVPGSPASAGCVTTPNSLHCRTELREENPSSWDPNAATNRLQVSLVVTVADDSSHGTVIGQIHIDDSVSTKPVCELYYNQNGDISIGVEQTRSGGDEVFTNLGNIPIGTVFNYELEYSSNVLKVAINGEFTTLSTFSLDAPTSYFKVGNYNQGSTPSDVHFFSISVEH
ncbi:polysaccharide lyase family 7 protein [Collybiopsis luxurians FD-317 M1]|uniref:Polysaccharide lyase family 7 protein n=1 Tax=Collybiopsis luxurians FD-317 M1 TaxID=944289 RepID=A0A0D0B0L6_9AGAR|nr:polysaccharide lyase family 7 protein [Collybiopsis luxurians FD-317 M1]